MGSTRYKLGRGYYTLDNFRFYYDPIKPKTEGQDLELSQVKIEMLSDVVFQTWEPVYGDIEQSFKWEIMPLDFWNELKERFDEHISDSSTEHQLVFHNKDPEETWTILINSLTGVPGLGYQTYEKVNLKFTLLEQVV